MVKSLLIGGIALSAISAAPLAASAQTYGYNAPYNSACERQNQDNKTAGTVIGAIVGAAAGGAIGNNVGDNDSRWHYNSYGRHGRWGRHGRHAYWDKGNNDGEVVAGAKSTGLELKTLARQCDLGVPLRISRGSPAVCVTSRAYRVF